MPYRDGAYMPVSGLFCTRSIDFTGPLPVTSTPKKYLIVAVENMTGLPVRKASISADCSFSVTLVKQEILNTIGFSLFQLNNNGKNFSATYVNDFAKKAGLEWKFFAAYSPHGNGQGE